MGSGRLRKVFKWLGGLVTLPRDTQIELISQGKLYATRLFNADLFRPGSFRQFGRFVQMGAAIVPSDPKYNEPDHGDPPHYVSDGYFAIVQAWVNPDTRRIGSLVARMAWDESVSFDVRAVLYSDAGGPDTLLQASTWRSYSFIAVTPPSEIGFEFVDAVALLSGTTYHFGLEFRNVVLNGGQLWFSNDVFDSVVKYRRSSDTDPWLGAAEPPFTGRLVPADPPINGLWDVSFQQTGGPVQFYGAACGGHLFAGDPDSVDFSGSWGNAIWEGGSPDRLRLWNAVMFRNRLFVADGVNQPRAWDGVFGSDRSPVQADSDSTMAMGYRSPLSLSQASGSGAWSATGLVQVLIVTRLLSGGYRASYANIVLSSTGNNVVLGGLAIDQTPDEFYFDIEADATTIFCTPPGRGIFYKVPASKLSTGANPVPNTATSVTIFPMSDAVLEAEQDLESLLGLPTGYFVRQVDAPKASFFEVYSNCLFAAGVSESPSSVYVSAQNAPNIWSEYGLNYGVRLDIEPDDGDIVTGLKVADRALFVSKRNNMYRLDYTGDTNEPWRVTRVHGSLGSVNHWSMEVIPSGLLFMSEKGPALCYGTYAAMAPGTEKILNIFGKEPSGEFPGEFSINWAMMPFICSAHEKKNNRVSWLYANGSGVVGMKRNLLIYDYEQAAFTVRKDTPYNCLAMIKDSEDFEELWAGNYFARAFKVKEDFAQTDNMIIETPWLDLDDGSMFKDGEWIWLKGKRAPANATDLQSLWTIVLLRDQQSSNSVTIRVDARLEEFELGGIPVQLPFRAFRELKIRIISPQGFGSHRHVLESLSVEFTAEGQRR